MNVYFSTNFLLLTEILVIIFKQTFCQNYTGLSVLAYVFTPDNSSRVHELIPKIQSFHVWLMSASMVLLYMHKEPRSCKQKPWHADKYSTYTFQGSGLSKSFDICHEFSICHLLFLHTYTFLFLINHATPPPLNRWLVDRWSDLLGREVMCV